MLHALLEYAKTAGISGEAGFKPKRIRWLMQFSSDGEYVGLVRASDDRNGREFHNVPHLQFSGDTPMRQFLVDTLQFAVLYNEKEPSKKLLTKHQFFLACLEDSAGVEPILGHIAKALNDPATRLRIHEDLAGQNPKAKASDNVTFVECTSEGPRIIVEQQTWHDWWRGYWPGLFEKKKAAANAKDVQMRCFLSGELVNPATTHPKIKGLGDVGGNIETTLVGFNLDAFCSYGLTQSANAAISTDHAETYAAALNNLIANQSRRLAGTKVAYWYTHDVPADCDPISWVIDYGGAEATDEDDPPDNQTDAQHGAQATSRAGDLLTAIHSGRLPDLRNCFYRAISLSGNAGRVVVRDWMEGQFEELAKRVDDWFSHLSIVHRYGHVLAKQPKFLAVLAATVRDLKETSPPLETALWKSALTGSCIPYEAMARALRRAAMDIVQDKPANHARMGLLKAYLIRKEICQMTAHLNEQETHPAYLCGRMMAVLANIQYKALGDVGAGVVQRYYAAASATPSLVMGRLIRLAQTGHLPKIEKPLRLWFDKQLATICDALDGPIPAALTLEEQTLFAMGYYQQKAKRTETSETTSQDN